MTIAMTPELHECIAGPSYGLLAGDALGCAVEGWPPEKIRATYGTLQTMEEARERWRPAGLHSDDGQQALGLCDAILHAPRRPAPPGSASCWSICARLPCPTCDRWKSP